MRVGKSCGFAIALLAAVAAGVALSAHRRDEYLQAARLAVEPDRVELQLDLTPGIAVADATIADLDRDRDGVLSEGEKRTYVGRVLDAVVLELDGRPILHWQSIESTFPGLNDFRRGEGTIQLHAVATLPHQRDGDHHLAFRNTNQRDGSVYLANALVPKSDRVTITAQRRDPAQRDLTIDYVLRSRPAAPAPAWLPAAMAGAAILAALLMRPNRIA